MQSGRSVKNTVTKNDRNRNALADSEGRTAAALTSQVPSNR